MLDIKKYRKKPEEIEAIQLTQKTDGKEVEEWVEQGESCRAEAYDVGMAPGMLHHVFVYRDLGRMKAEIGDWIIRSANGQFIVCPEERFHDVYQTLAEQLGDSPAQRAMDRE